MVRRVFRHLVYFLPGCQHSCSICCILQHFAAVLWSMGPWGYPCSAVYLISACVVLPCAHIVFTALQPGIVILEDSGSWHFPPLPPSLTLNAGFSCVRFISIYLFYLFSCMFSSTELSGSSVMGAHRGLGMGSAWLDCSLGRPLRCSSALGCDFGWSTWALRALSLHLRQG